MTKSRAPRYVKIDEDADQFYRYITPGLGDFGDRYYTL